ncbi:glycoside hydrolase family 3 N-terminal domain-containing protein [Actinoallomurus bryophytorum]
MSQRVDQLLSRMTLDEKISELHGDNSSTYAGTVPAIPHLCIPALTLDDSPAGVGHGMTGVTQLPAPVAGAATWDTDLAEQYGAVIGKEQWGKGDEVDLGPTVNIVRDPRWGRAFESYGEDPYLAGQIGSADVEGIQATGEMAQLKHWAVYNQEANRNNSNDDAIIDQRVEQEIYLSQFETVIKRSKPASKVAEDGSVLLKNTGGILPLSSRGKSSVAVNGRDAGPDALTTGGGSAAVAADSVVTPSKGIAARAGGNVKVQYAPGNSPYGALPSVPSSALTPSSGTGAGLTGTYYRGMTLSGDPITTQNTEQVDFNWNGGPPAPSAQTVTTPYGDWSAAFNNIGISDDSNPTSANFDGSGYSYSASQLAAVGIQPGKTGVDLFHLAGRAAWAGRQHRHAGAGDRPFRHRQQARPPRCGRSRNPERRLHHHLHRRQHVDLDDHAGRLVGQLTGRRPSSPPRPTGTSRPPGQAPTRSASTRRPCPSPRARRSPTSPCLTSPTCTCSPRH